MRLSDILVRIPWTWHIEHHPGPIPRIEITFPNDYAISLIRHSALQDGPFEAALLFGNGWAFDDVFRLSSEQRVVEFILLAAKLSLPTERNGLRELDKFATQFR